MSNLVEWANSLAWTKVSVTTGIATDTAVAGQVLANTSQSAFSLACVCEPPWYDPSLV